MTRPWVVAVVGPTAAGKSELALALAAELGGEIVNADASQLYRGMDIGTAKLPYAARRGIPHHQLDVLDITQEASLAAYQKAARADLGAILDRGVLPILVGGSGLYVRAALDRLEIPPTDPQVRAALEDELAHDGPERLYRRLTDQDPAAARAIEPGNGRRIVRALEVIVLTGQPFSGTMPVREFAQPTLMIGLRADRSVLDDRVGARIERMWADGFLEEVRGLDDRGLRDGRTASRALGYGQALRLLDGELTQAEALSQTATLTRRLVRRQQSWFGADGRIHWLDATADRLLERARDLVSRAPGDNG